MPLKVAFVLLIRPLPSKPLRPDEVIPVVMKFNLFQTDEEMVSNPFTVKLLVTDRFPPTDTSPEVVAVVAVIEPTVNDPETAVHAVKLVKTPDVAEIFERVPPVIYALISDP